MELLVSFLDFVIGLFTFPVNKIAEKQNQKRGNIFSFKYYVVIFIIFLIVLFYFYG